MQVDGDDDDSPEDLVSTMTQRQKRECDHPAVCCETCVTARLDEESGGGGASPRLLLP